jgi:Beta-L-arabinofuranosidase, GH127
VLAYYHPGAETRVSTSAGATLAEAVTSAASALAATLGDARDLSGGRLELDVPTSVAPANVDQDEDLPLASIGLEGVLVTGDDGRTGVVLPAEVVERGFGAEGKTPGLSHAKIAPVLAARAGVETGHLASMRAYRFGAAAYVEASSHDAARLVTRGMVERPAEATPETLLAAVRRGADYLTRILDAQGRYVYIYHPVDGRDDASYGMLRHAGTTYAIFEAYEELGTPAYLVKGELALRYLKARLRDDPASEGKYVLDTDDEAQQRVGGAGLALLAFAKDAVVTGSRGELETMRALARVILKAQYEDGHFRSNADVEHETGKKLKREPVYYPGEAVLGLMRLYALDPQPAYLEAARRGADWVVHVRDAYVSEDHQEHDHWMCYAMNELYRVTSDRAYVDFAYKIARAIQKKQQPVEGAPAPDFAGTFYDGETTPASTRLEAYDSVIALSRFVHEKDDWLIGPALAVARSTLGQQFDADNDYWLRDPAKAEGGVRESLFVQDVRIDYVQHAMSAWLHLARILRDPAYGKAGTP